MFFSSILGFSASVFFLLELAVKMHRVLALAAKGATIFLNSHGSCGCCSPGTPQLHSVWHQLSSHSMLRYATGAHLLQWLFPVLFFVDYSQCELEQIFFIWQKLSRTYFTPFVTGELLTAVVDISCCNFRGTQMTQEFLVFESCDESSHVCPSSAKFC